MIRSAWCLFFVVVTTTSLAQIRLSKLVIQKGERYEILNSDIAVIDTLVMQDSSTLLLNWQKKSNFLHAKKMIVGKGCQILGAGRPGKSGKAGEVGAQYGGPCRAGADGMDGGAGLPGNDATNLNMYLTHLELNGSLTVNLNGGSGGDGGKGGNGGSGGSGTKVCPGGNGGKGGNGGTGGEGGKGGNLLIQCKECPDLRLLQNEKLFIKVYGGYAGLGGAKGTGGQAGLGPTRDGKNGTPGTEGPEGQPGKEGTVIFERIQ